MSSGPGSEELVKGAQASEIYHQGGGRRSRHGDAGKHPGAISLTKQVCAQKMGDVGERGWDAVEERGVVYGHQHEMGSLSLECVIERAVCGAGAGPRV